MSKLLSSLIIASFSTSLSFSQGSPNYSSWELTHPRHWNVVSVFVHWDSPNSLPGNWSNCRKNNGGEHPTFNWNNPPLAITPDCDNLDTSYIVKAFDMKTPTWHYYYMSAKSDTSAFVHTFNRRDSSYTHYNQFKDYSSGQWIDLNNGDTIPISAFIPTASRSTDLDGFTTMVYIRYRGKSIPKGKQKKSGSDDNSDVFTSVDQYQTNMQLSNASSGNYDVYSANGQLLHSGTFNYGHVSFSNNAFNSRLLIVVIRPEAGVPVVEKVVVP